MKQVADNIPGYSYGTVDVPASAVSMETFAALKGSAQFTEEDARYLHLAGEVLSDQTQQIVDHWRGGIIASIPNLSRHSRTPEGEPLPQYLSRSNLRFRQWILDTCLRAYDQQWLDYQQEIALRHTAPRKNQVDGVHSTAFVPLSDAMAFITVINETIKPYLAKKGHSSEEVSRMHLAWCKSMQLQLALWIRAYAEIGELPQQW